jgi:predicted RNA-binding Zn ribbon-like protein
VVFAHDTEISLQAAVTLVNTGEDPDTLTSVEDLDAFYARFEFTGRRDGDEAELDAVRRSRPRLRALLTAERDEAVEMVNEMLREAHALPQLTRHDRFDWHLHAVDPDAPLERRIVVETAMAMIDVIRSDEMSRLGVCAQDDCEGIVLDLSRNRSKIFCGSSCSNRAAVAAYRARKR